VVVVVVVVVVADLSKFRIDLCSSLSRDEACLADMAKSACVLQSVRIFDASSDASFSAGEREREREPGDKRTSLHARQYTRERGKDKTPREEGSWWREEIAPMR
jgi:hypothetical protein